MTGFGRIVRPLSQHQLNALPGLALREISEGRPIGDTLADVLAAEHYWRGVVKNLPLRQMDEWFHTVIECPTCEKRFLKKEDAFDAASHGDGCAWLLANSETGK